MRPLTEILARAPHVLLDFDGPVCAAFAGVTDRWIADQLRTVLADHDVTLPAAIATTPDPFEVLRYSAEISAECTAQVDAAFVDLEQTAVAVAPATPGATETITALRRAGHTVTIVSNNSEPAIHTYLEAHDLSEQITGVIGRVIGQPVTLKPHPHSILRAIQVRATSPAMCVLVGDSASDIEAAHAAGTASIAYANKPGKRQALSSAHPDAVIDTMSAITNSFQAHSRGTGTSSIR